MSVHTAFTTVWASVETAADASTALATMDAWGTILHHATVQGPQGSDDMMEDADPEIETETVENMFQWACSMLRLSTLKSILPSWQRAARQMGTSLSTMQRNIHAAAEASAQLQSLLHTTVLRYIRARESSTIRPVAAISHWFYDETPLVM
eukprot:6492172-Amphidinium_carterae.2